MSTTGKSNITPEMIKIVAKITVLNSNINSINARMTKMRSRKEWVIDWKKKYPNDTKRYDASIKNINSTISCLDVKYNDYVKQLNDERRKLEIIALDIIRNPNNVTGETFDYEWCEEPYSLKIIVNNTTFQFGL